MTKIKTRVIPQRMTEVRVSLTYVMQKAFLLVFVLGLALQFTTSALASAGLKSVGLGISLPTPMGDVSQVLNHPVGYLAEARLGTPQWFPDNTDFRLSAFYFPFSPKQLGDSSLRMLGMTGGLQLTGGSSFWGISPFFSTEMGLVYSALGFSGATGATANNSLKLALQFVPGFDFPIFKNVGGIVELPMMVVFQKSALAIWNGSFSLRWQL